MAGSEAYCKGFGRFEKWRLKDPWARAFSGLWRLCLELPTKLRGLVSLAGYRECRYGFSQVQEST